MKLKKQMLKVISMVTTLLIVFSFITPTSSQQKVSASTVSASQAYVNAMGHGWNLGNSFDSFDTSAATGETSWGNPTVTKELLHAVKEAGFDSIRIPLTAYTRIGDSSTDYELDDTFMDRYEEVVGWALDEGFYVMINLHHDSSEWLKYWDGSTTSDEYLKYVSLWTQLADRFKDYGDHLMFESINEPTFSNTDEATALATINQAFYDVVRNSGGNNDTRMLVVPTLYTNDGQTYCTALYNQITGWDDENIIATIHYYSEWVFSANLGMTRFDEVLWDSTTPRTSLEDAFSRVYNTFTANGIGVVVGEYGLQSIGLEKYAIEDGEGLKYFEYINYLADQDGICLMLWDNGEFFDRTEFVWQDTVLGDMFEASMNGRSSYATDLDTIFITGSNRWNDVEIPLTLNGNTLQAIYSGSTQLVEGTDYTYSDGTVTILGTYLGNIISGDFGLKDTLRFVFSSGADWYQYINYSSTPYMSDATGTTSSFSIPVNFKGDILEKVTSKDSSGNIVSSNTWWNYLQYYYEFCPDYDSDVISLTSTYFAAASSGTYTLTCVYYSGATITYSITVSNGTVTGTQVTAATDDEELAANPSSSGSSSGSSEEDDPDTVDTSNVDVTFSITNDWTSGCICSMSVTNNTGVSYTDGWTLEFDFEREIGDVWGATLESSSDGHYVVTNNSYSTAFADGDTITFTFSAGSGSSTATPTNVVLSE